VKIEYVDITPAEFEAKMQAFQTNLDRLFAESRELEEEIRKQLKGVRYE
jgi:type I restriction enzyme M protein